MNLSFLFENLTNFLVMLLISSARIATTLIIAPFFGPNFIQGMARNVVIINLSLIMVPFALTQIPGYTIDALTLTAVLAKEAILGFLLGMMISILFAAAESAGAAIDFQRGSSISQAFDPTSGSTTTLLGGLFTKIAVYVFFVQGGIFVFMAILYKSFGVWPIFSFYPNFPPGFADFTLQLGDLIMKIAVLISAPIFIVLFFSEFGLGMLNRFAPQLNVFSISMSVKSGLAALILVFYIPSVFILFGREIIHNHRFIEYLFNIL